MPMLKMATGHHIKSKAQMRFMFAKDPQTAERIARKEKSRLKRLPEKKHPQESVPKSEYGREKLGMLLEKFANFNEIKRIINTIKQ